MKVVLFCGGLGLRLRGILRLHGVESNAPERYAEAFYARKLVLGV